MILLNRFVPSSKADTADYPIKIGIEVDGPAIAVLIHFLQEYNAKVSIGNSYHFDELQAHVMDALRTRDRVILTLWVFTAEQVFEVLMTSQARLTAFDVRF